MSADAGTTRNIGESIRLRRKYLGLNNWKSLKKMAPENDSSPKNVCGLLETICGEYTGALTTLPGDTYLPPKNLRKNQQTKTRRTHFTATQAPLLAGKDGIRLSLAGAQNTIPTTYLNNLFFRPIHGFPSTHTIIPPTNDQGETIDNKAFCMALPRIANGNTPGGFLPSSGPGRGPHGFQFSHREC